MNITESQFIRLMSVLTDAKRQGGGYVAFSLSTPEMNNLYNQILEQNRGLITIPDSLKTVKGCAGVVTESGVTTIHSSPLETKILLAKELGITFKMFTSTNEANEYKSKPLEITMCSWAKSRDEDFEERLDLMIKKAKGLDYVGLLKKYGLI